MRLPWWRALPKSHSRSFACPHRQTASLLTMHKFFSVWLGSTHSCSHEIWKHLDSARMQLWNDRLLPFWSEESQNLLANTVHASTTGVQTKLLLQLSGRYWLVNGEKPNLVSAVALSASTSVAEKSSHGAPNPVHRLCCALGFDLVFHAFRSRNSSKCLD